MKTQVIALAYDNQIEKATLSSPSTFVASMPLSRVQNRQFQRKARRLGNAALRISGTFPSVRRLGAIALAAHNFSSDATWRVRMYSDTASIGTDNNKRYDSGYVRVWPRMYDQSQLEWEDPNFWTGGPKAGDLTAFTPLAVLLTDPVLAGSFTIDVTDSSNTSGWLELGRIFIANLFQPECALQWGSEQNFAGDTTSIDKAKDGTEYFDRQRPKRTLDFQLANMEEAVARGRVHDMKRVCGIDGEILVVPTQVAGPYQGQQVFVGRMQQTDPLIRPLYNSFSNAVSLLEIV